MPEKYTLICSDGSLQGGYIAGAIIALYENFPLHFKEIDLFTASSASVGNLLTYLSYGKENKGESLWTEEFSTPDFVKFNRLFKGGSIVDVDHLVDNIIRKKYPLKIDLISNNNVSIEFPAYDVDRDEIVTFTNISGKKTDNNYIHIEDTDPHIALKAAMAVPILYDKAISVFGRRLIDAGMICPIFAQESHLEERKVIIIANRTHMSRMKQIGYSAAAILRYALNTIIGGGLPWRAYSHVMRKREKYYSTFNEVEERSICNLVISPSRKLHGSIDNSKEALRFNFDLGYRDVTSMKAEINKFFSHK